MTEVVNCRDVDSGCGGVVKVDTEDEIPALVADHTKSAYGPGEVTPAVVEKIKSVVHDAG